MTELRFDELPETPKIWIDFLSSRLSFRPAPFDLQALQAIAGDRGGLAAKREDLCRLLLRQSGSVAVVADLYPSLFGGPVAQILKCMTAIKVCEELARRNLAALPVCWIDAACSLDPSKMSVTLLDQETELHCLQLQTPDGKGLAASDAPPWNQVSAILLQIEEIGRGTFDTEVLEILKGAYISGTSFSSACAHLISELMKEWGMVVLDAGAPSVEPILAEAYASASNKIKETGILQRQTMETAGAGDSGDLSPKAVQSILARSLALPVVACIIDPCEVQSYARALPVFDRIGLPPPLAWPRASATLVDRRSRRTLERYNLDIGQLYEGAEKVLKTIGDARPHSTDQKIDNLKLEVETRLADLVALAPAGDEFVKASDSCEKKILYQLEKLRENWIAAGKRKEQAASRRTRQACNSLAPNRRAQERELAGIQIPLRYSRAGLRSLYEKLDILTIEHQLISMD